MRFVWMLVLAASLGAAGPAYASKGGEILERARSLYESGNYPAARDTLTSLLKSPDLSLDEIRQARTYLAASYYFLGDEGSARKQFDTLFRQNPFARVDPVLFPPEVVELSDQVLKQLEAEQGAPKPPPVADKPRPQPPPAHAEAPKPQPPPAAPSHGDASQPAQVHASAPRRTPPSVAFAFIPFGVGQFANEQYLKGAVFLGFETVSLVSFVAFAALAESLKDSGTPFLSYHLRDPADEGRFQTYQTAYIVSFWTGFAIYALGVADALISRPSQSELDAAPVTWLQGPKRRVRLAPNGLVVRF